MSSINSVNFGQKKVKIWHFSKEASLWKFKQRLKSTTPTSEQNLTTQYDQVEIILFIGLSQPILGFFLI